MKKRHILFHLTCVLSLIASLYMIVDLIATEIFNYKLILVFGLFILVAVGGITDKSGNDKVIRRQEEELKMYRLYVRPLEELVKEIRIRQHEFDNHLNALLNMHVTIDQYDELVKAQAEYIGMVGAEEDRKYLPLLKISDKVLAGFLYSKIVKAPDYVNTELHVRTLEIISGVSASHLIEIIGTLVDNAYEACTEAYHRVDIELDSRSDRLIFKIQNDVPEINLTILGRFFEKGYSTKADDGSRGLGLYRAKTLVEHFGGEITVAIPEIDGRFFVSFQVQI